MSRDRSSTGGSPGNEPRRDETVARSAEILGINRRNLDLVFADYRPGRFRDLDDKIVSKRKLEAAGVAVPRTIAVVRTVAELDEVDQWLDGQEEVVVKPARGWGGRGILVLERDPDTGSTWRTPGGRRIDHDRLLDHLDEILAGSFSLDEAEDQALLEERIHPHPFLRELYPRGLSDLRLVIEDGEPVQAMLRVPTDASDGRANLHGGGLGLGVDLGSGRIRRAVQKGRPVDEHPDTATGLLDLQLPEWERCLEVARRAAEAARPIRYLGVDIVIDERRGPLVLELNARPGLAIQVANREGQPVRRRRRLSGFDLFTQRASWLVLLGLCVAPWIFQAWEGQQRPEIRAVRPESWSAATDEDPSDDTAGVEWSDEATPVSARSERFARARAAAAAGDTVRALSLYREAAQDPTLTPFASNNIALIARGRGDLEAARSVLERALADYPEYARGHYNLGLIRRDLGDVRGAETSFRTALAIRPSHARSWSEFGELLLARDAIDSARVALEQAVRFNPDAIADRRRLGRALLVSGRTGEAATRFAQALALSPGSPSAARGWVDARLQHAAERGEALSEATLDSLRDALRPHVDTEAPVRTRALWAELKWTGGDALGAHEELGSIDPVDLDTPALVLRTLAALELGFWDDAATCTRASDARRLDRAAGMIRIGTGAELRMRGEDPGAPDLPDAFLACLWTASVRDSIAITPAARRAATDAVERTFLDLLEGVDSRPSALGMPTPARIRRTRSAGTVPVPGPMLLWAAADRDPRAIEALDRIFPDFRPHLLARFLEALDTATGDPAAAQRAHDYGLRLLRADRSDPMVILPLIELESSRQRADLARGLFERLDEPSRRRPDARLAEARILLAEGEADRARRRLTEITAENPLAPEPWILLGRACTAAGREEDAVRAYDRALQLVPDRADVREGLARALMEDRRYADAAEQWTRLLTLDLDPGLRRSALFNLALALQRDDRLESAVEAWDRCLQVAPEWRSAVYNRALALDRLGRTAEAIAGYRRALEIDPDHEASRERLGSLVREDSP